MSSAATLRWLGQDPGDKGNSVWKSEHAFRMSALDKLKTDGHIAIFLLLLPQFPSWELIQLGIDSLPFLSRTLTNSREGSQKTGATGTEPPNTSRHIYRCVLLVKCQHDVFVMRSQKEKRQETLLRPTTSARIKRQPYSTAVHWNTRRGHFMDVPILCSAGIVSLAQDLELLPPKYCLHQGHQTHFIMRDEKHLGCLPNGRWYN